MSMNIEVDEFLLYSWEHEDMRGNCRMRKIKLMENMMTKI